MASLYDADDTEKEFFADLGKYPSTFNLECKRITDERLKTMQNNLQGEVEHDDIKIGDDIPILNLLTWVVFKLGNRKKALELSDTVLEKTGWNNIVSVANRAYLLQRDGKHFDALDCLEKLDELKEKDNFESLMAEATADQAFSYFRMGGPDNLRLAMEVFSKAISQNENQALWKFQLGLCYRRSTPENMYFLNPQEGGVKKNVEEAAKLLFDVGQTPDAIPNLRGLAFAELAMMRFDVKHYVPENEQQILFRGKNIRDLCDEAFKHGGKSAWILTTCGRALESTDLDKAIECLEGAVKVRQNSTAYHHLGRCYRKKAEGERGAAKDDTNLDINNPLVAESIKCFKQAIEISREGNVPAIYDLGLILKDSGQLVEALAQFNIVSHPQNNHRYVISVIDGLEQAGLCLIQMMSTPGVSVRRQEAYKREAEQKLTKAVGMAANSALSAPELKDPNTNVWGAYRTLKSEFKTASPSPEASKKLLHLQRLVGEYMDNLDIIEELKGKQDALGDPEVVRDVLESYLGLREYEKAYSFLNMVLTSWKNDPLALKVSLLAGAARLQTRSGDAEFIFNNLFNFYYSMGDGRDLPNDVLIIYDEFHDTAQGNSEITKAAFLVQEVLSSFFGLKVSRNLQSCFTGGIELELQLEEIKNSKLVLVLLGKEPQSSDFKRVLHYIPSQIEMSDGTGSGNKAISMPHVQIVVSDDTVATEEWMRQHTKLCLNEIKDGIAVFPSSQTETASTTAQEENPEDGATAEEFNQDVHDKLKLFCFLILQHWPL